MRPVEIYRKRTRLLWLSALGLGGAALFACQHYDNLWPFTWKSVFDYASIAITGIPGLVALSRLLLSCFRREPYLLVYDDRVEMTRWLSKTPWLLHFSDVEDMTDKGGENKTQLCCKLKPFLQKSDLPQTQKLNRKFSTSDYTIGLSNLDISGDEAYDMILDRYLKYQSRNRKL